MQQVTLINKLIIENEIDTIYSGIIPAIKHIEYKYGIVTGIKLIEKYMDMPISTTDKCKDIKVLYMQYENMMYKSHEIVSNTYPIHEYNTSRLKGIIEGMILGAKSMLGYEINNIKKHNLSELDILLYTSTTL